MCPNDRENYLTLQMAANILNLSASYFLKLLKDGVIPSTQINNEDFVLMSDLMAFKKLKADESKLLLQKLVDEAQELDMGY
ncbi:helix-turn-helix domain-containing protein [Legionella sp. PATHC032]|uniref:hypothetical protein n=1 Tax=Legionella sp. PATHC032 TaxID=2992039 RepID=UPI001B037971|nr:hypothetical protein [Legionella sp. PATHC032]MCW8421006.1 helix-turn-helix domain-containing protein [Legionella sp. PATHC032]HAZ7573801.1 hypothetical protein [Legionella pneumophila]HBA1634307.1 hypothetical protein [Legionella pneumophila]